MNRRRARRTCGARASTRQAGQNHLCFSSEQETGIQSNCYGHCGHSILVRSAIGERLMTQNVDVFLDFRSPYSYLATPEFPRLSEDFDVNTRLRYGLPLAIRKADFFRPDNVQAAVYLLLDWERRAEMLGLPHAWPSPDPIVQDFETMEIAAEQPYIYRVTYLGMEAEKRGRGIEFAQEVFRLIFGGTQNWHLGDHLREAAVRSGLDYDDMARAIEDPAEFDREIEENHLALAQAGHWGVPTMVFNGEPFFGQDRIETLRWRLAQEGLSRAD